jgi:hypothetical protein
VGVALALRAKLVYDPESKARQKPQITEPNFIILCWAMGSDHAPPLMFFVVGDYEPVMPNMTGRTGGNFSHTGMWLSYLEGNFALNFTKLDSYQHEVDEPLASRISTLGLNRGSLN